MLIGRRITCDCGTCHTCKARAYQRRTRVKSREVRVPLRIPMAFAEWSRKRLANVRIPRSKQDRIA